MLKLKSIFSGVAIVSFIFVVTYFSVQPDPKGIGIWFFAVVFGSISTIVSVYFIFKSSTSLFVKALLISSNTVNVYLFFTMIKSLAIDHVVVSSMWVLLALMFFAGTVMWVMFIYRFLKKNKTLARKHFTEPPIYFHISFVETGILRRTITQSSYGCIVWLSLCR